MTLEDKYDEAIAICNQIKTTLNTARSNHQAVNTSTEQNNLKLALKKATELIEDIQSLQKK
jgi:hypothetical protein